VYHFRKKLKKMHQKYKSAVADAILAGKIIISFLQINMSVPGMLSEFEWPEQYRTFLTRLNFVNVDFMSIVGIQCVMDYDFRFSVFVALCVPLCWLQLCITVSIIITLHNN